MDESRVGFGAAVSAAAKAWLEPQSRAGFDYESFRRTYPHAAIERAISAAYGPLVEALTTQLRAEVLHDAVLAVHNARFYNPANAAMDTGYWGVREAERALYRIGALLQLPNDQHPHGYPPPSAVEGLTT